MSLRKVFRARLSEPEAVLAPLVLDPLMACTAANEGFEALYLGGGAMGYAKTVLEANLGLSEMCHIGTEIIAAANRALILDGAAGWGDAMHQRRTTRMAEAAGFVAIEIEDQLLPKRAHHHIGIEHMIPAELMAAKVKEAVRARRDEDFLIIARTNGIRVADRDEAVRRLEIYKHAGADALLSGARDPETLRFMAERLPAPLVCLLPSGGLHELDMSLEDISALGYKLLCDTQTALFVQYQAAKAFYRSLKASGRVAPPPGINWKSIQDEIHDTIDLEGLLQIERDTVEK